MSRTGVCNLGHKERTSRARKEISIQRAVGINTSASLVPTPLQFSFLPRGWKILKGAKEASNSERLVSLGWELVQCARHHTEVVHICAVNCDCKLGSRIVI
jgi:hypothetical protein